MRVSLNIMIFWRNDFLAKLKTKKAPNSLKFGAFVLRSLKDLNLGPSD